MNWSEYSRFVGDVFGAPLAIEALLAFFLESTFLGLWIFGWDRLPKKVHLAVDLAGGDRLEPLGASGSSSPTRSCSSRWATSLRNGRAEMESFWALVTNPHVFVQFPHVITGAMATAAFFVLGISAWHLARATDDETATPSAARSASAPSTRLVATLAVIVVGHTQAQYMITRRSR